MSKLHLPPSDAPDVTLREAQEQVHAWVTTVGVRYFNELNTNKIQALGRSGWASHTAVTGSKRGLHIISVPFTSANKRQSSGDITHLVMQE